MSIAQFPAEPPKPIQPPEIKSREVHNEVVDTRYHSRKSLMTYAGGMAWLVTYYSQILGDSSEPMALQVEESGVTQQYRSVRNLMLKVQTDLQRNPDTEKGLMEVTGAAHLMPGINPNVGDMFVADIGDGNAGVFAVTGFEQLSIYADTAFLIEYGLVSYLDKVYEEALRRKVVEECVYDIDYARTGKNPIIAYSDYVLRDQLLENERSIIHQFLSRYYDHEWETFMVPDQFVETYDPAYGRFLSKLIDNTCHPARMRLTVYDESCGSNQAPVTIWDLLINQDMVMFRYMERSFTVSRTLATKGMNVLMGGLAYSGIQQAIYPHSWNVVSGDVDISGTDDSTVDPLLFPTKISITPYYVFSEAFYAQRLNDMNELERQIYNLVSGKPINSSVVDALTEQYYKASELIQYYTFPFMVCLYRTAAERLR